MKPLCSLLALLPWSALRGQTFDTAAIQLPAGVVLTGVLPADLDGDVQRDLVLACRTETPRRRELRFHRRAVDGTRFTNTPTSPPLPLDDDVIAFAVADLRPTPGQELVLLTAERAVLAEPGAAAGDEPRYESLGAISLVWPAASREFALPLRDAGVDLDGDRKEELLLPEGDGAVWLRADGAERLRLPPFQSPFAELNRGAARLQGDRSRLQLQIGGSRQGRSDQPLASVSRRVPAVQPADLDGDGRVELLALRNDRLFVAAVGALGTPAVRPLPLPADRLQPFDPDFDVQLNDVDGDRRLDLLLTTSARRGDDIEVRIDLFRVRDDGSWPDKPDGRLRLQTLAAPPQLADADGDGRLDLLAVTMRTDALRGLTGDAPTALEAQLNIYRNVGGRFSVPAAMSVVVRLPIETGGSDAFARLLPATASGSGTMLLRADGQLQRRPLARNDERLRLLEPDGRLPLTKDTHLLLDVDAGEILVLERSELLHVSLR